MLRLLAAYCLLISCLLAATTKLAKPQALLFHPSNFDQHPSLNQPSPLDQLPAELRPYWARDRRRVDIVEQLLRLDEDDAPPPSIGNADSSVQPLLLQPDDSDRTGTAGDLSDVSDVTLPPGNYSYTSHAGYGADLYPHSQHRVLRLMGTGGQFINFSCDQFWLEKERACRFDYLSVNGQRFCGKSKVTTVTATSLELVFHTDSSITMPGFSCRVEVPPPPAQRSRRGQASSQTKRASTVECRDVFAK